MNTKIGAFKKCGIIWKHTDGTAIEPCSWEGTFPSIISSVLTVNLESRKTVIILFLFIRLGRRESKKKIGVLWIKSQCSFHLTIYYSVCILNPIETIPDDTLRGNQVSRKLWTRQLGSASHWLNGFGKIKPFWNLTVPDLQSKAFLGLYSTKFNDYQRQLKYGR